MSNKATTEERKKALAGVTGTVLEVGFGSGLNLPWYAPAVRRVVAVDPSREGAKLARKRIAAARLPVEFLPIGAEAIAASRSQLRLGRLDVHASKIQRWQHRLNKVHNVICGGCNTNRDIRRLIAEAGFEFEQVDEYYVDGAPKFARFITRGIAHAVA